MKTFILIALTTLIWGYTWSVMKVGLEYFPPILFAVLRLGLGAVTLLGVVLIFHRSSFWPAKEDWRSLGIMGMWMSAGFFGLLTYGMQFVSSGETAVLVYTMPIMVSILAHFMLGEKLHRMKVLGLILGAVGLVCIIGITNLSLSDPRSIFGQALIIVAAFSWAMANVYSKKTFKDYNKMKMTAWQMMIGTLVLTLLALLVEDVGSAEWTLESVGVVVFTGLLSSAFAFVAWFWVLNRIEASTATMTLMIVPVLGIFLGWLHLDEAVTASTLWGVFFIVIGIGLVSYQYTPRAQKSAVNRSM